MIILDTNVISELARPQPHQRVVQWLDGLPTNEVRTTSITAAELLYGVARLPDGRRRSELAERIRVILREYLDGRVEPFDLAAAEHYADIVAGRDAAGRPIQMPDAQIAAICRKLRGTLATRNTKDFVGTDIELVDPWTIDETQAFV